MSSFYPQGMVGYNNRLNQGGYKSWKGTGFFSNPIGITWGTIRPYTNNDLTNNVIYKPGPRPIKHYRKGISVNEVRSSRGNLVSQLMDMPGCVNITPNTVNEVNNIEQINNLCDNFKGVAIISDIYPTVNYCQKPPVVMQANNQPITVKGTFCCSQPKNALRKVRSSTNLKQNYYTTTSQYLQNRCQTFEQKSFNFLIEKCKPEGCENYYVANCLPSSLIKESEEVQIIDYISNYIMRYDPSLEELILRIKTYNYEDFLSELFAALKQNPELLAFIDSVIQNDKLTASTKSCGRVIYKPNNTQFATQGAVSASNYILKKDVTTLETYDTLNPSQNLNCNNCGNQGVSSLYKTKSSSCLKNGVCNSLTNIKTYGNRPSKFSSIVPELVNRKYMPNYTLI